MINEKRYKYIAANITADAIIPLAGIIKDMGWLSPDGMFIASGIIKGRLIEVVYALDQADFIIAETNISGEWVCLCATPNFS